MGFTKAPMSKEPKERAKKLVADLNAEGYSLISACFGITGIQRIIANAVKRDMYFARDIEDAKNWLVKQ